MRALLRYTLCLIILVVLLQTTLGKSAHPSLHGTRFVTPIETPFPNTGVKAPFWRLPRRELTSSDAESCVWEADTRTCGINPPAMLDILRSSKSGLAGVYLHSLECQVIGMNETACVAIEKCGWDRQSKSCAFVDYLGQYPDSPCVANAPLIFTYSRLFRHCPPRTSSISCGELEGCTWDEELGRCYADLYHVVFGLESQGAFLTNTSEVDQIKISAMLDEVMPTLAIVSETIPDWYSIFTVKTPKTDCPEGYDQLICDYVDTYLEPLFPHFVYCRVRYSTATKTECDADPVCSYSEDEGCARNTDVIFEALALADELLLDRIPDSTDKTLVRQTFGCERIQNEMECTDNCRWSGNFCVIKNAFMDKELLKNAERNSTDAVCQMIRIRVDANCTYNQKAATCRRMESCRWVLSDGTCKILTDKIREELTRQDPKLEKPLSKATARCASLKNAKACAGG